MAVKVKIKRFARENIAENNFELNRCQGLQFALLCSSAASLLYRLL